MAALYNTSNKEGVDVNAVFILDPVGTPEIPAPPFNPGERCFGTDGSAWVYCTASITIAAGSLVVMSGTPASWSVALLQNTLGRADFGQKIGVVGGSQGSMVVPAPTGTQQAAYFWAQVGGNIPKLLTSASINANVALHTSAIAGKVGASVAGTTATVAGIVFSQTAAASGTGYNAIATSPTVGVAD